MTTEDAIRALELARACADAALDALASRVAYIDRVGGFMSGDDRQAHRDDKAVLETHRPIAVGRTRTWRNR
jgi:hypothetical protein